MKEIVDSGSSILLDRISSLLEEARNKVVSYVNHTMIDVYWNIGREIVEFEQGGKERAEYGTKLLETLSNALTVRFGKGFSERSIERMRKFYLMFGKWPTLSAKLQIPSIFQTVSGKSRSKKSSTVLSKSESQSKILPTVSAKSDSDVIRQTLSAEFKNLSWSHYVFLMQIDDENKRNFYMIEANENRWSVRELRRQFDTSLYHRLALSKNKKEVMKLAKFGQKIEKPEDALKEPYILEFLGLEERSSYSENDLESAIISHLQKFLLEMGKGWTFVERQKRITNHEEHYYVDLVFYHRFLNCFILVDLKKGKLTHQDIGQMQMYVNYFDREVKKDNENNTIGLLLCEQNNGFVVEYTIPKGDKQIYSREYKLYLPDKKEIEQQLKRRFIS